MRKYDCSTSPEFKFLLNVRNVIVQIQPIVITFKYQDCFDLSFGTRILSHNFRENAELNYSTRENS